MHLLQLDIGMILTVKMTILNTADFFQSLIIKPLIQTAKVHMCVQNNLSYFFLDYKTYFLKIKKVALFGSPSDEIIQPW
jgi:hypothetical protein